MNGVNFLERPECIKCTIDPMDVKEYGVLVLDNLDYYCPECALYIGLIDEEEYEKILIAEKDMISCRNAMNRLSTGKDSKIKFYKGQ